MLRRRFLSTATAVAGFSCIAAAPARAISLEPAPAHLRLGAPVADGAVDWELLAQAGDTLFRDGAMSRFPAALRELDGESVLVSGYMMPLRDGDAHREFLMGALQFHCVSCMTGDLARLVAVRAASPVRLTEGPLLVRGTLRLLEENSSPLFYRLDAARAA